MIRTFVAARLFPVPAILSAFLSASLFGLPLAHANTFIACRSKEKVDGWKGSPVRDFVRFTAVVETPRRLSSAQVSGAYLSETAELQASRTYRPRNSTYVGYNRFGTLEDAWHWFSPLLPRAFPTRGEPFTGYLRVVGESSFRGTIPMTCVIRGR